MGGTAGPCVYRISRVKEAGFDKVPADLGQFLDLCRKLKKNGHPSGFALGHALGDANGYANFLLWAHGGRLIDEAGKVALDSKETRAALDYAKAMQETMIPGTLAWGDANNNKAYAAGDIGLTANGVSIYYAAKTSKDPAAQAIAADTDHALMPQGSAAGAPQTCTTLNAMLFKHTKFPNAAKSYLTFMMEAPQYDPWLTACLGYWSEPLKAYKRQQVLGLRPQTRRLPHGDGYAVLPGLCRPGERSLRHRVQRLRPGRHVRPRRHRRQHTGRIGPHRGSRDAALLPLSDRGAAQLTQAVCSAARSGPLWICDTWSRSTKGAIAARLIDAVSARQPPMTPRRLCDRLESGIRDRLQNNSTALISSLLSRLRVVSSPAPNWTSARTTAAAHLEVDARDLLPPQAFDPRDQMIGDRHLTFIRREQDRPHLLSQRTLLAVPRF